MKSMKASKIRVRLVPVLEKIDIPTVIKEAILPGDDKPTLFVATQPGLIWMKRNKKKKLFLDIRDSIGKLGCRVPALPGIGFTEPGTYDERGIIGMEFHPLFKRNGVFYLCYSNINQFKEIPRPNCENMDLSGLPANPCTLPYFFEWKVGVFDKWTENYWDHVEHLEEWHLTPDGPEYTRTILSLKRPFFNHVGLNTIHWSPEFDTLTLHLGDGGSEWDPFNIAQDMKYFDGKLILINLEYLGDKSLTKAVVSRKELRKRYPDAADAFQILGWGLRNPNSLSYERYNNEWIKYMGCTGQNTLEYVQAFDAYDLNFGFRPWEGIFPSSMPLPMGQKKETPHKIHVGPDGKFRYQPAELTVKEGDEVIFKWKSDNHSVTQTAIGHNCRTERGGFDSGVHNTGYTYTLKITKDMPAVIQYHCTVGRHCEQGMEGTIHVKENHPLGNRAIMYPLEAANMPNFHRPFVNYSHLNEYAPRANSSSIFYRGPIKGLTGQVIYTDWMSASKMNGLLMHSSIDRDDLEKGKSTKVINVDLPQNKMQFTVLGTNMDHSHLALGTFTSMTVVKAQSTPEKIVAKYGAIYEIVPY